ncbi:MAG: DNA methyltransferase [Solirubrobacteraceae bacterium]
MSAAPAPPRLFASKPAARLDNAMVFTANMTVPVHRWFRYSAGFSAAWVQQVIQDHTAQRPLRVLDPFAGSGTTLVASRQTGAVSIGLETHPLVARVARAKLNGWEDHADAFEGRVAAVLTRATPVEWRQPPDLMAKIYSPEVLSSLCGLRIAVDELQDGGAVDDLTWLALISILRICSPVGTAPWQYVLPNKTKARVIEPVVAFSTQASLMVSDMRGMGATPAVETRLFEEDARKARSVPDGWADLVITSPPYPNNYDYADATRIEMTFLQEINSWGDLQQAVRSRLVRSCSQHMVRYDAEPVLASNDLAPIVNELTEVYVRLALEREQHGGRKNYHAMVVAYFADLA